MLAIRMQRTGRKGHAMFRMVVQDARRTPTSGKIVAQIGAYDPHAKNVSLDKDRAAFYLKNGAQPSDRAAKLLAGEGVKLPSWVATGSSKAGKVRNPDKRRSTRPAEETPAKTEEPAAEAASEAAPEPSAEVPSNEAENKATTEETPEA